MSKKTPERQRLKIPEPLRQELLELSARASPAQGAPMPKKTPERERIKIPKRLRKELLRETPQASSGQGAPMPKKTPERERLKIPERLRKELLREKPQASSGQGASMLKKTPERERLKIPERLRKELLREKPQASSGQGAAMPGKSPPDVPSHDRNPNAAPVSVGSLEGATVATQTKKRGKRRLQHLQNAPVPVYSTLGSPMLFRTSAPVPSGTPQGALIPRSSPQQKAKLGISRQQRQKRWDQWRQQLRQQRQQKASQDNANMCEPPAHKNCVWKSPTGCSQNLN
ncbi:hypothetical protein QQF64_022334 [Cirrhinus molitorella]|uniref:Uncharacterized protein n=1 Tax=Cirrhinus molitorella TaxID=172907 RepID=A0ABR3LA86_9TELE